MHDDEIIVQTVKLLQFRFRIRALKIRRHSKVTKIYIYKIYAIGIRTKLQNMEATRSLLIVNLRSFELPNSFHFGS